MATLRSVPPNVASLKWDPASGSFEATFFSPEPATPEVAAEAETESPPGGDFRFALERIGDANFPASTARAHAAAARRRHDAEVD
jgi:hypothetical protein